MSLIYDTYLIFSPKTTGLAYPEAVNEEKRKKDMAT